MRGPQHINWINFSDLKYKKKLSQPKSYDESKEILTKYFEENNKYNLYTLCLYFDMSAERFKKYYLNSEDKALKELMHTAMAYIAGEAMSNEEEYKRTLKYILAQTEIGQPFLEVDDKVLDATANKVVILPAKK